MELMGILSRFKAAPKQQRVVSTQWNSETYTLMERLRRRYGVNPEIAEYLAHATGEAHICASMNATACMTGVLRLYKRVGAGSTRRNMRTAHAPVSGLTHKAMQRGRYGRKLADFTRGGAEMIEVEDHPMLDLLSSPNDLFPGDELGWLSWYYRFIGGNAYDQFDFDGGTPVLINPLYAQFVHMVASVEEGVAGYWYGRSNHVWGEYTQDEVIHYRLRPSPHTPLYGMGAMHGMVPYVELLEDSLLYDIALAKNGMRPDYTISVAEGTNPDQVEEIEKRLTSKFRGVANWVKPLITIGETKVQPLAWPEKELMSMAKREEASKLIRKAFGHTESMDDSNDSTYAAAQIGYDTQFLGGTIEPALQTDASTKNSRMLAMFGLDPDVYSLAYDPLVEKDEAKYTERLRLDVASGLRKINEARVELGLEESDDPMADRLLINGQPLGAVTQPSNPFAGLFGGGGDPKPVAATPAGEELPSTNDEPHPPGSAENPPGDSETAKSVREPLPTQSLKDAALTLESPMWRDCEHCRQTKDDDEVSADPTLKDALWKYAGGLDGVAREILTGAQRTAITAYAKGDEPNLSAQRDAAALKLEDVMKDIVRFGVTNFLKDEALGRVPEEAFTLAPTRALESLRKYTFELADDLMGTTAEMAKAAVTRGLEQGMSIDQIAGEMEGVPEYRARAIARTETQRAVQHGKREAMLATGVEQHRVITAPGVRKSHAAIAAQGAIPIDQPFVKAGETYGGETFSRDMYTSPFGVNCRCGVLPVYGDDQ